MNKPVSVKASPLIKRGDVYWVLFDGAVGSEIKKRRPAVVVSNDSANRSLDRFQVLPLTSNTGRLYSSEAIITLRGQKSKAMADQITTASIKRFGDRLGHVTDEVLRDIERAIRVQLGLIN